ncbi:MAG: hypothetical protein IPG24_25085 [Leptospiraceae bacterium]|nr:hypothetical protein [Leptospiraceae bacterium]
MKDIGKSSYPNIRYIRHKKDYQDAIDTSSEDDIKVCLKEVKQIYEQLKDNLGKEIYE